jgi:hypothetical protein
MRSLDRVDPEDPKAAEKKLLAEAEKRWKVDLTEFLAPELALISLGMNRLDGLLHLYVVALGAELRHDPDGDQSLENWVSGAMEWELGKQHRKVQKILCRPSHFSVDAIKHHPNDPMPDPADKAAAKEIADVAPAMLTELQWNIVKLHIYDGFTFRQIGCQLGMAHSEAHRQYELALLSMSD